MVKSDLEQERTKLLLLGVFTFVISPITSWFSITASDETAVFASLSRFIWYSGSAIRIFVAMLVLFIPMLAAFFRAHKIRGLTQKQKLLCRVSILVSCAVLYIGAMELMPSDGNSMTGVNIWHGILSFGGMLMIFLTYCLYVCLLFAHDKDGASLLAGLLAFTLVTGAFAVLNIFDGNSYVIASAVSELYVLTMLSLIGYMTYYLAYRSMREPNAEKQ